MRRMMLGLVVGAFVVGSLPVVAAETTVKGELVEQACFLKDKTANHGADHKDCTESCLKKGKTPAVVTQDGTVYAITGKWTANKNEKLVPFATKMVEVTGEVTESGGTKSINASAVAEAK